METSNFKNIIEKLEYVGENIYLLFRKQSNLEGVREIILVNFLKELLKCDDKSIILSLNTIILQRCEECYYDEYRSYRHYENEQELQSKIKSIDQRFHDFIKDFN